MWIRETLIEMNAMIPVNRSSWWHLPSNLLAVVKKTILIFWNGSHASFWFKMAKLRSNSCHYPLAMSLTLSSLTSLMRPPPIKLQGIEKMVAFTALIGAIMTYSSTVAGVVEVATLQLMWWLFLVATSLTKLVKNMTIQNAIGICKRLLSIST